MKDPHVRAVELELAQYSLAKKPTTERTHALVDAFLTLIASRSGLKVSLRVGDGVISRVASNDR